MNQFEPPKGPENRQHPSEILGDLLRAQSEDINRKVLSERLSGNLLTSDGSLDPSGYGDVYTAAELEADAEEVRKREVEWAQFYRGQPGIKTEDDMIQAWKEYKNRQKSGQMEMAVTGLLSQMLGEDFIVVRTAPYDDYINGVDNLIVNRVTKEVIGAFDEVHDSQDGPRTVKKKENTLKIAQNGGVSIRYGLGFKRKTVKREKIENVPVFYLGLEESELAELIAGLHKNDPAKKEKIFQKLVTSLSAQQKEFLQIANALPQEKRVPSFTVKLRSFGEVLARFERVPLQERNTVQAFIFQKEMGEKPEGMDKNDWARHQSDWYDCNGEAMSYLIDKNAEVRKLITAKQFEAAADLVITLLHENSTKLAA